MSSRTSVHASVKRLEIQFPVKGFGIFMQQLDQPGHKADQQPPSSVVLKNAYNYREAARSRFDPGNRLP